MNSHVRRFAVVLVAGAAVLGCNGRQTIDTGSGAPGEVMAPVALAAQANTPISDLPVPVRMDLADGDSRSFAAAGVRWVDHIYRGRANKWAVGRFFKRQMPTAGWTLVADRMLQGKIFLNFTKANENCDVVISSLFWGRAQVQVGIYPTGKSGAP